MTEKLNDTSAEQDFAVDLATETLTGDIRDFLLDRVKTMGKPYHQTL